MGTAPTMHHATTLPQVRAMPVRKDDEVQVVRGTFKVRGGRAGRRAGSGGRLRRPPPSAAREHAPQRMCWIRGHCQGCGKGSKAQQGALAAKLAPSLMRAPTHAGAGGQGDAGVPPQVGHPHRAHHAGEGER